VHRGTPYGRRALPVLLRREGLYAISTPKYRPKRERPEVAETRNLLLQAGLEVTAINQLWHVDLTYIPTHEGWLYLAGVSDGLSKRIVGYATTGGSPCGMAEHMKTDLVLQALRGAVQRRKPAPELSHHSDKGSQYTSSLYQRELAGRGMCASFTGKGACFDNAVIESFWATLKRELVYPNKRFATRAEARAAIFDFVESYYNRERLHSSLNYETPERFESLKQPSAASVALAA
jgi:putative transposase